MRLALALVAVLSLPGCASGPLAPFVELTVDAARDAERAAALGSVDSVRYVIHVSIDGLRPDAVERQPLSVLPHFTRLRREGAWTHDARTDADLRKTLPNHATQLTGRPVLGDDGHQWTANVDPPRGTTLHSNRGAYVASVFDVVHDAGLATAAYVSKSKFSLFRLSYDAEHGAPDATGDDDGRAKIDRFRLDGDTDALVRRLVAETRAEPAAYTFLHVRDPDWRGHIFGWNVRTGSRYLRAVQDADARLGQLFDLVDTDPRLRGRTVLIVTSDHGGSGRTHYSRREAHYTIPFYVWGPGIPRSDLYADNPETRADPGSASPGYDADPQPIRNGDAANLALAFLGLEPVPGSTIGRVPLAVVPPGTEPAEGTAEPAAAEPAGAPVSGRPQR